MLLAIIVGLINRINAMVKLTIAANKDEDKLAVKAKVIKQRIKLCAIVVIGCYLFDAILRTHLNGRPRSTSFV